MMSIGSLRCRQTVGTLGALVRNARVRHESMWVAVHKSGELVLMVVTLKLFTAVMGVELYGAYSLWLAAMLLVGHVVIVPVQQAFLRREHQALESAQIGHDTAFLIRWFQVSGIVLVGVALLAGLTGRLPAGLQAATLVIAALGFVAERWRLCGVLQLENRRMRKEATLQDLGAIAVRGVVTVTVLIAFGRSQLLALACLAGTAAIFAVPTIRRMLRERTAAGAREQSGDLWRAVLAYGYPAGALMACQWVQNSSERFILGLRLDIASAGMYIAAYQICGVPFMWALAVLRSLLLPVAFQRSGYAEAPDGLWPAYRVLALGVVAYAGSGLLCLPLYYLFGDDAVRLIAGPEFVLSPVVLTTLALTRFLQCLGPLLEGFFLVRRDVSASLLYRLAASVVVVPACWFLIGRYGVAGAAAGVFLGAVVYVGGMIGGPGGVLALVRKARA